MSITGIVYFVYVGMKAVGILSPVFMLGSRWFHEDCIEIFKSRA